MCDSIKWIDKRTNLNSNKRFGPGCSNKVLLSEQSEARSGAEGELPARRVR